MQERAEDLVIGRWPEILCAAGLDSAFLTGRNGPCPFCGGKDRYQFRLKNGGCYVCRNCTDGRYRSGFDLLMRHMGYHTFKEAADHVRSYLGVASSRHQSYVHRPAKEVVRVEAEWSPERVAKNVSKMQAIWDYSRPVCQGDPVDVYLRSRIPPLHQIPEAIRYHPSLPYWSAPDSLGGRPTLLGYFPAMIVRGFDKDDNLVQLHKTYLTSDGKKADVPNVKKTDVGIGSNSYAFRLGLPVGDTIGVAEGIETALSAMMLAPGVVVWPCQSASIMANFQIPNSLLGQLRRVIIYADTDEVKNGRAAGQQAAAKLADSLKKCGLRSLIVRPAKRGGDMNDIVQKM